MNVGNGRWSLVGSWNCRLVKPNKFRFGHRTLRFVQTEEETVASIFEWHAIDRWNMWKLTVSRSSLWIYLTLLLWLSVLCWVSVEKTQKTTKNFWVAWKFLSSHTRVRSVSIHNTQRNAFAYSRGIARPSKRQSTSSRRVGEWQPFSPLQMQNIISDRISNRLKDSVVRCT